MLFYKQEMASGAAFSRPSINEKQHPAMFCDSTTNVRQYSSNCGVRGEAERYIEKRF